MPSWRVHDRYAIMIGVPTEVSYEVNNLIDFGSFHDIGIRRLNEKKKWWMVTELERVEQFILNRIYGYEENIRKLKKITDSHKKQESAEIILSRIASSKEYTKAFVLHHMLDMLCNHLIVSFEVLLRSFPDHKATISSLKTSKNFIATLRADLKLIKVNVEKNMSIGKSIENEVLGFLEDNFDAILNDADVKEWVDHMVSHRMKKKRTLPDLDKLEGGKSKWMDKMEVIYRYVFSPSTSKKLLEGDARRWATNSKLSILTKWLIDRNNIWEIMRLSGYNFYWASNMLCEIYNDCMDYLIRGYRMYRVDSALKDVPQELSIVALRGLKKEVGWLKESIEINEL